MSGMQWFGSFDVACVERDDAGIETGSRKPNTNTNNNNTKGTHVCMVEVCPTCTREKFKPTKKSEQ